MNRFEKLAESTLNIISGCVQKASTDEISDEMYSLMLGHVEMFTRMKDNRENPRLLLAKLIKKELKPLNYFVELEMITILL